MFSNDVIIPLRRNKPHICVREGWWRVSPKWRADKRTAMRVWNAAHSFVNVKNARKNHGNDT